MIGRTRVPAWLRATALLVGGVWLGAGTCHYHGCTSTNGERCDHGAGAQGGEGTSDPDVHAPGVVAFEVEWLAPRQRLLRRWVATPLGWVLVEERAID